jgi:hypothetical protein
MQVVKKPSTGTCPHDKGHLKKKKDAAINSTNKKKRDKSLIHPGEDAILPIKSVKNTVRVSTY